MDQKDSILTAAAELMGKVGIKSISIDDICRQIGISKKTFYVHFDTKDALVEALLKRKLDKEEAELEQRIAAKRADFDTFRADLQKSLNDRIRAGEITLQTAGIEYMKTMLEELRTEAPTVVIGMAPPYYPCVSNTYFENDSAAQIGTVRTTVERLGMKLRVMPFFTGIGDCSYMVCADPTAERELMRNVTLAGDAYDIPFEAAHALHTPCFFIGPRCRDIHRWEERVYVPDLVKSVPDIVEDLLK